MVGAVDCESRGRGEGGGRLDREGARERGGGFRDQVGRLIARRKGKGDMSEGGRSAAGWLLSVDEHCRAH